VQVPRGSGMQVGLPGVEASGWGATVENTVREFRVYSSQNNGKPTSLAL